MTRILKDKVYVFGKTGGWGIVGIVLRVGDSVSQIWVFWGSNQEGKWKSYRRDLYGLLQGLW